MASPGCCFNAATSLTSRTIGPKARLPPEASAWLGPRLRRADSRTSRLVRARRRGRAGRQSGRCHGAQGVACAVAAAAEPWPDAGAVESLLQPRGARMRRSDVLEKSQL